MEGGMGLVHCRLSLYKPPFVSLGFLHTSSTFASVRTKIQKINPACALLRTTDWNSSLWNSWRISHVRRKRVTKERGDGEHHHRTHPRINDSRWLYLIEQGSESSMVIIIISVIHLGTKVVIRPPCINNKHCTRKPNPAQAQLHIYNSHRLTNLPNTIANN